MRARISLAYLAAALVFSFPAKAAADVLSDSPLEQAVCTNNEEGWIDFFRGSAHFLSWFWRSRPDVSDDLTLESFRVSNPEDGRRLQVYKVVSKAQRRATEKRPKRLLFIQGNAMAAGRVIFHVEPFARAGFEVYLMEFRGYGLRNAKSEGKAYLNAVVSDFKFLAGQLQNDAALSLYGISFGGAVVMKLIADGVNYEKAVVDSTPSDFTCPANFGCPSQFFALENVPRDSARILALAGLRDPVVEPSCSQAFRDKVRRSGGCSVVGPDWTHPLYGEASADRAKRTDLILGFLATASWSCRVTG